MAKDKSTARITRQNREPSDSAEPSRGKPVRSVATGSKNYMSSQTTHSTPETSPRPEASTKIYVRPGSELIGKTQGEIEQEFHVEIERLTGNTDHFEAGNQFRVSGSGDAIDAFLRRYAYQFLTNLSHSA